MQVGSLVKLSYDGWASDRPADHYVRIGIVAEWDGDAGWIQWAGNPDWDIEYKEDLDIINEAG
jgi:hypothetical protein